jgi:chemotaxis protein MotA
VLLAILLGGGLASFLDLESFLIVIGGTIGATLITFPLDDFARTLVVLRTAFFPNEDVAHPRIARLVELAKVARSEGELSLEQFSRSEPDPFFRKAIELIVDRIPPDEARRILEIEMAFLEDRHRRGAQLFQTMGTVAPAMGLIGTLIGLVRMLEHLEDPSRIGPGMALALLTTFYGALLAYILFLPLAGKLRARSEQEVLIKEITVEGIMCIAQGTNPRLVEQRLLSFLPPEQRYSLFT